MVEKSQGGPGSAEQMVIDLLKEQVTSLERERDLLRDELAKERARIEGLTARAVAAETRAEMLARTSDDRQPEVPAKVLETYEAKPAAGAVQAAGAEMKVERSAEQKRRRRAAESKWWEFWKRWERQEPWGRGHRR